MMSQFTREENQELKKAIANTMRDYSEKHPGVNKELLKDVLLWMLSIINQKTNYTRSENE